MLHPLPERAFTVAFGITRRVNGEATVSVEGVRYSVPHQLVDTRAWVWFHGDELIVTAVGDTGPDRGCPPPTSTWATLLWGAGPANRARAGTVRNID